MPPPCTVTAEQARIAVRQLGAVLSAAQGDIRRSEPTRAGHAVRALLALHDAARGCVHTGCASYLREMNTAAGQILPIVRDESTQPWLPYELRAALCQALRVADVVRDGARCA